MGTVVHVLAMTTVCGLAGLHVGAILALRVRRSHRWREAWIAILALCAWAGVIALALAGWKP